MKVEQDFIEGVHFYYNESRFIVFTEKYHLERGSCCGNGCKNCPYDYENVPEPIRRELLKNRRLKDLNSLEDGGVTA